MAFQYGMLMRLSIMLLAVLVPAATSVVATTRASSRHGGEEDEKAIALPGCKDKCGNLRIPYPFGIGDGCYSRPEFNITCKDSNDEREPTTPRLMKNGMIVTNISLEEGELQTRQLVNRVCYDGQGKPNDTEDQSKGGLSVTPPYTISGAKNILVAVGCDTNAQLVGSRDNQTYTTGCISKCDNNPGGYADSVDKNDTFSGMGYCRTKIHPLLNSLTLKVASYKNHTEVHDFNSCGYAFVLKMDSTFNKTSFQDLRETHRLPLVLDWQIREESCAFARQNNKTFACKGNNSICKDKPSGYICLCKPGFQGNPYLPDSCKDIDECALNSTLCNHGKCKKKVGNYTCVCDRGYKNLDDITCIKVPSAKPLKISLGVSLSFCVLLAAIFWKYRELRIRRVEKLEQKCLEANGFPDLQEITDRLKIKVKIFTEVEVKDKDATNNYDKSKKVGEGRYGIVYRGKLKVDGSNQMVAIKRSKVSVLIDDQKQITSPVDDQEQNTAHPCGFGLVVGARSTMFGRIFAGSSVRSCVRCSACVKNLMGRVLTLTPPWLGVVAHFATIFFHQKKKEQNTAPSDDLKKITQQRFRKEMTALCRINHKNIVRFVGCCLKTPKPILVYEFMSEGTLYEHIHEKEGKKRSPLRLAQRLKIAAETAEALAFLHHDAGMQIIHSDVKTTKILLDENLTAKLSGFGASRLGLEDENQISTLVHGTVGYEDPEYLDSKSNTLTEKSDDVYSFGVVLAELLTGLEPEKNLARFFVGLVEGGKLDTSLLEEIVEGHFVIARKAADLAKRCLKPKRKERPSMKEVAAELNRLVRAMGPHTSGGEEADISPSPEDIGNLVGSSASIASGIWDTITSAE